METKNLKLTDLKISENYRIEEKDVGQLMSSIKESGLINPITVKKVGNKYELLAGHRRYWATKKLGLKTIRATVMQKDSNKTVINLIENIQRETTSSFEVGRGINALIEKEDMSKSEVASRLGIALKDVTMYLDLYERTPVAFRKLIRKSRGRVKKGFISNNVASSIVALAKCNLITAAQTKELMRIAKRNESFTVSNVRVIRKRLREGHRFTVAVKGGEAQKAVSLPLSLTKSQYKTIKSFSPKQSVQKILKDAIWDYFDL